MILIFVKINSFCSAGASILQSQCRILVFCFDREFKKIYVTVERSELERIQDYCVIDKLSYSVGKTKALNLLATLITVN